MFWTQFSERTWFLRKLILYFGHCFRMILHRCKTRFLFLLWLCVTISTGSSLSWQPCPELSSALRYPCRCKVEPFGPKSQQGAVSMDCDNVVFHSESPILPNRAPIISFSQRYCGQQVLPTQVNQEKFTYETEDISTFFFLFFKITRSQFDDFIIYLILWFDLIMVLHRHSQRQIYHFAA